ncbi:MAG TPA: DUF5916 domain-containing protein [Thermoanaerobaculia bacterium]|jgi:hypothetical protein|nr:DUF5916 domain-containing protein [Thermoanaerobaculia bacterium]
MKHVASTVVTLTFLAQAAFASIATSVKPVYHALRAAKAPAIDGDLSDDAWKNAEEISDFTQQDPNEGKPATQKTVVKVVYTDEAIYFGVMMFDTRPVQTRLGRRDSADLQCDWVRVNISPQHDNLSGAEFFVNPANVQVDGILYNDIYDDYSWDGVWTSGAKILPGVGWSAELRIPYSQLRFSNAEHQTWGVNVTRVINSNHETDRLVQIPKTETGWVSRMAELTGIDGIHPEREFELMPYGVARSDVATHYDATDPFAKSMRSNIDGGLDVKYGLSSNLTFTGTINPDFGQVEVDPAVVNLSQFETFFPEKRPFFTEGAQMFRFGTGPANNRFNFNIYPPQFFYSRRIGRAPQGTGSLDATYSKAPTETTILGAGKVTGKFGNGWSVGVLDAVTSRETALAYGGSQSLDGRVPVEPATNYMVSRMTKEYGNSRVGFLFESVNRHVPRELSYLRRDAYVAGVDGYTNFHKNAWLLEWQAGMTRVDGTAEAIADTQTSPAHYYDRPDADYLHYDPKRTSLDGFGGRVMLGKQTGHFLPNFQIQTYSPGFEVNDIGYEQRVDITATHAVLYYDNQDVTSRTRERSWWVGKYQNWNYGGDLIANGVYGRWYVQWLNYLYGFGWGGKDWQTLDDRRTRGGPLALRPGDHDIGVGFGNDSRKKLNFEVSYDNSGADDGSRMSSYTLTANYHPTPGLLLSLSPSYTFEHDATQYVDTLADSTRVFSQIDQRTFQVGTRVEWTVSSRLSFQLYTQPLVASGAYYGFKSLAAPRTNSYVNTFYDGNPDFNFRSVRGSAVARWEFRPGSAVYFVWNENRSETEPYGDFRLHRDLAAVRHAPSQDVFLIKVSYWLPI